MHITCITYSLHTFTYHYICVRKFIHSHTLLNTCTHVHTHTQLSLYAAVWFGYYMNLALKEYSATTGVIKRVTEAVSSAFSGSTKGECVSITCKKNFIICVYILCVCKYHLQKNYMCVYFMCVYILCVCIYFVCVFGGMRSWEFSLGAFCWLEHAPNTF